MLQYHSVNLASFEVSEVFPSYDPKLSWPVITAPELRYNRNMIKNQRVVYNAEVIIDLSSRLPVFFVTCFQPLIDEFVMKKWG